MKQFIQLEIRRDHVFHEMPRTPADAKAYGKKGLDAYDVMRSTVGCMMGCVLVMGG